MENNAPQKKQLPAFLVLGIIAIIAAVVLAATNAVTKGPIEEHKMAALKDAFNAVMPAESYEEMSVPSDYEVNSLYAAKQGGQVIGYCVTAVSKGYNGDVAVTLGVDTNGLVTGCSVGDTSFAETAGFGARAKEPAFQEQFKGIDAVNGGTFEALSGATVTSTAVLNATNAALRCVDAVALNKEPAADPLVTFGKAGNGNNAAAAPAPLTGSVMEGVAVGYDNGEVKVQYTLDDAGAISALTVDASSQTPGLGQRCAEDEFTNRFIGKTIPVDGVDALSGATITSNAVIEAINNAQSADSAPAAGAMTGMAKGFASDVKVNVALDEAGAIASLTVDASGETAGLGQRCAEEEFTSRFIGKTIPVDGVDALSGATITSNAVIEAVNNAKGADNASDAGARTAAAKGFASDVKVSVTLDDAGAIASLTVDASGETAGLGQRCAEEEFTSRFIGQTGPFTLNENIDALSGATVTSGAVVEAVNAALTAPVSAAAPEVTEPDVIIAEDDNAQVGVRADGSATVKVNDAFDGNVNVSLDVENGKITSGQVTSGAPAADVKDDEPAADALTATAKGFDSDVKVSVTLDDTGAVASLTVDASGETPGLGQKCAEEDFTKQFIGKTAPFVLNENVDAVAGATITSSAVVEAVNAVVPAADVKDEEPAAEEPAEETASVASADLANKTATGAAQGKVSEVVVRVTTDGEGKIKALVINASGETKNVGTRVMSNGKFAKQFTGEELPVSLGDGIDALAGATVTSQAVVDAINNALLGAAVEVSAEQANTADVADQTATGAAQGKVSEVVVRVTTDGEGKIKALVINASGETKNVGTRVMSNGKFAKQFTGKELPVSLGDGIDALAGATVTSQAVVDAINAAFDLGI